MRNHSHFPPLDHKRAQVLQARQRRDNILGVFMGTTVVAVMFLTGTALWISREASSQPASKDRSALPVLVFTYEQGSAPTTR